MKHHEQEPELPKRDKAFTQVLATTLNKSLDEVDEVTRHRLKQARAQALSHAVQKKSPAWIRLSVAASLGVLLLAPFIVMNFSQHHANEQIVEVLSQDMPDAQELDDIDMLMAMEDADA